MSNCNNCGRSIKLKEREGLCPSCGKNPFQCWNCQADISGSEEECSICHFFICEACGKCGANCELPDILEKTKDMSKEDFARYCYAQKDDKARRICSRNIPISYAHGKLRDFYLKMSGLRTKGVEDVEAFELKLKKIKDYPIGRFWTINNIRDAGTHGYEFREASNFAVCSGMARCEQNKIKEVLPEKYVKGEKKGQNKFREVDYWRYIRVEEKVCEFLDISKAISYRCNSCKTEEDGKICKSCKQPTEERASNCNICNLNRDAFRKKEVVDGSKLDRGRKEENS